MMKGDTSAVLLSSKAPGNEPSEQKVSPLVGRIFTEIISAPSTIADHGARICVRDCSPLTDII
jgi:hypothetical protein